MQLGIFVLGMNHKRSILEFLCQILLIFKNIFNKILCNITLIYVFFIILIVYQNAIIAYY